MNDIEKLGLVIFVIGIAYGVDSSGFSYIFFLVIQAIGCLLLYSGGMSKK